MKINLLKSLPETWSKKPFKTRSRASVKDKILSWKLDKEYFDKAMQRINNHTKQLNLFK